MNLCRNKLEYLTLSLIIICATWIRLTGVTDYYYHADELIHSFVAHGFNLGEVFIRGMRETHPPLGHFLKHFIYYINDSLVFSRSISVACGLGAIILAYMIGKNLKPQSYLGLAFAIIIAFSGIAVIYTTSGRNYAFLLITLLGAYLAFLRYGKSQTKRDMLAYLLLTLIACSIHFTGFIFTFGLSATIAITFALQKNYRTAIIFFISHILHMALLAALFYFFYFKSQNGQEWYKFYTETGKNGLFNNNILIGIMSVYFGFFAFSLVFFAAAFPMSVYGCFKLWKVSRIAAISIVIIITLQIILTLFHIYPMVGSRYCLYLMPIIALPLAYCITDILDRLPIKPLYLTSALIICIIAFSAVANSKNLYFNHSNEFTTTNQSFFGGVEYLRENLGDNDIILTNKGSWMQLLNLKDKTNSGYFPKMLGEMDFEGRQLYFLERNNKWEYLTRKDFYDFLPMVEEQMHSAKNVWIVAFGTSDFSIFSIYNCPALKPYISKDHIDRGVLVFQIDKKFALDNFYPVSRQIEVCMEQSDHPFLGRLFDKNGVKKY